MQQLSQYFLLKQCNYKVSCIYIYNRWRSLQVINCYKVATMSSSACHLNVFRWKSAGEASTYFFIFYKTSLCKGTRSQAKIWKSKENLMEITQKSFQQESCLWLPPVHQQGELFLESNVPQIPRNSSTIKYSCIAMHPVSSHQFNSHLIKVESQIIVFS